jgi:valyl-tRNA synthetase
MTYINYVKYRLSSYFTYTPSVLEKAYDPKGTEDRIYAMWEDSGALKADANSSKEPFTISMPPPNATGQLHLGHAVMLALEDIFTRFARMQGKEALWVPGTDHAAIATESVVIKKIQKEEKIANPRTKYGREGLVAKIAEFVEQSRGTIRGQVRKMGSSCDWSRERYTLDPSLNRCVNEVFKKMYEDGLIYRGNRVVNWDTALQTTISDDEIEYKDTEAVLYTIEYLTAAQTGGAPVLVATSRPETKLGDSALVVHPDDDRYKHLIGKTFIIDWPRGQSISVSIIADHTIDPVFGTGVLGLTPFHSKIDYEIWQRHKEEVPGEPLQVIGEDGRLTEVIKGYAGMTVEEARAAFVEDLRAEGRLIKEDKYIQPLSVSYRSGKAVEILPKLQWFIDVNKKVVQWKGHTLSLKEVMLDTVHSGDISIVPDHFEKTYFHWIENLHDWCISRQIWWGHRVPVWYKRDETYVGVVAPEGDGWEQDSDTLDTWFSSALWTWSTLIDPALTSDASLTLNELLERSPDFQKFHPTNVMETGYDILPFWVARMILMTTYVLSKVDSIPQEKKIPFSIVYLHGLVRTRDGAKMSKSKPETMIDPLDMISSYGADALRLSMIVGQSPGADSRLYEEKIAGYRNFINKLWNASRFVLMQCEAAGIDPKGIEDGPVFALQATPGKELRMENLSLADRAILHALEVLTEDVTKGLETYSLSETGEKLYSFTWDYFCDWYLELSKGTANHAVLVHVLRRLYKLLHPYCPFITEELWAQIKPVKAGMLMAEEWPQAKAERKDQKAFDELQILIDVITSVRRLRTDNAVEPSKEISVILVSSKHKALLESQESHIKRLGKVGSLQILSDTTKLENVASVFLSDIEIHLSLEGLVDVEKEKASLSKDKENLERFIVGIEAKLGNKQFMAKAPEKLVTEQKEKLAEAKGKVEKIAERLKSL